jgi:hypothetical protein
VSLDRVNVLNIGLMVASTVLAFTLPFELFLFSYAVLGPLHYLTQISWLHTRGYFTTGKNDYLLLIGLCACIGFLKFGASGIDAEGWATTTVIVAFAGAAALAFASSTWVKAATIAVAFGVGVALSGYGSSRVIFATFVPTIIHVYVFTAAFILYGAMRSRSATGIASLAVFVACSVSFFLASPVSRELGPYVTGSYSSFEGVNVALASYLGFAPIERGADVYYSATGVMLMRFIAFAYTYHFLNWFSKTSVIQWHKIPRSWGVAIVCLWVASLAVYAWDYRIGMLTLFTLSFLHVFLEFPLDMRTFVGIGQELRKLRTVPSGAGPLVQSSRR